MLGDPSEAMLFDEAPGGAFALKRKKGRSRPSFLFFGMFSVFKTGVFKVTFSFFIFLSFYETGIFSCF